MSAPKPGQHGEPWHTDDPYYIYIWAAGQKMVADLPGESDEDTYLVRMRGVGRGLSPQEQRANAQRIVACVNALDGRDPAALAGLIEAAKDAKDILEQGITADCPFCAGEGDWTDDARPIPVRHKDGCVYATLRASLAAFGVKQ